MFWGDTSLVFWESLGRFDRQGLARIDSKISQMANLFLIYFPLKVTFWGRNLFLFTSFWKINLWKKEFLQNSVKFPQISQMNSKFWRILSIFKKKWQILEELSLKNFFVLKENCFSLNLSHLSWKTTNFFKIQC